MRRLKIRQFTLCGTGGNVGLRGKYFKNFFWMQSKECDYLQEVLAWIVSAGKMVVPTPAKTRSIA